MYILNGPQGTNRRSIITTSTPLDTSSFSLDVSGVSGFFGGDEAVSAMVAVHLYLGQRWLGWYNIPGSYQIAKRYGLLSKSATFKGLYPGDRTDLAKLFGFDGQQGPTFQAAHSNTIIENTGHLAFVLMNQCTSIDGKQISGKDDASIGVTIIKLKTDGASVSILKRFAYSPFFAIIPIIASLATCVTCGVYKDWFSFSLILWGILSNGITSIVLGSGTLFSTVTNSPPTSGSPPQAGDGILGSGTEFALLQGEEGAINCITSGKLSIKFPSKHYEEYIGCCSVLLTTQSIAQLFLISQGSLFGQIMFIASLAISWAYILCLSAVDKDKIQQRILVDEILTGPPFTKLLFPTLTSAIVFAICVLSPEEPMKILEVQLPSDTKVWRRWKETIAQRIREKEPLHFDEADWNLDGYTEQERSFLQTLFGDAQVGYDARVEHSEL